MTVKRDQPTALEEIGPLYANLMEEIKRRVDVIQRSAGGQLAIPPMAAFELCYLQLRKVCEVFALACIAAHGDIPEVRTNLLQKSYNADQIIKQLERLHPNFYPIPTKQVLDPMTGRPVSVVLVGSGFLTKDDLLGLYGECGNYLHRGSIRQLLTNWEHKLDFEGVKAWVEKIVTLLNHHQIEIRQPGQQLWVLMHGKDDGKVHWFIMKPLASLKK